MGVTRSVKPNLQFTNYPPPSRQKRNKYNKLVKPQQIIYSSCLEAPLAQLVVWTKSVVHRPGAR